MRYGRKSSISWWGRAVCTCVVGICTCGPGSVPVFANSEDYAAAEAKTKKANRYDGVRLEVIPRPPQVEKHVKAEAVFTTLAPLRRVDGRDGRRWGLYDQYVKLADRPFVPRRRERVTSSLKEQLARVTRRYSRKSINALFRASPDMDEDEYRQRMGVVDRIGSGESDDPRWAFRYGTVHAGDSSRYEREWDDASLLAWGPVTVTDSGNFDLDMSLSQVEKLWSGDLEDIIVAPAPPTPTPVPLIGQKVHFRSRANVRISSSRFFKTFYQSKPDKWPESLLETVRYAKVNLGADFYTDILKRRYFGTELEFRLYLDGEWAVFLNVVFESP